MFRFLHELQEFPAVLLALSLSHPPLLLQSLFRCCSTFLNIWINIVVESAVAMLSCVSA